MAKQVTQGGKSVTVMAPMNNHSGNLQARGGSFSGGGAIMAGQAQAVQVQAVRMRVAAGKQQWRRLAQRRNVFGKQFEFGEFQCSQFQRESSLRACGRDFSAWPSSNCVTLPHPPGLFGASFLFSTGWSQGAPVKYIVLRNLQAKHLKMENLERFQDRYTLSALLRGRRSLGSRRLECIPFGYGNPETAIT